MIPNWFQSLNCQMLAFHRIFSSPNGGPPGCSRPFRTLRRQNDADTRASVQHGNRIKAYLRHLRVPTSPVCREAYVMYVGTLNGRSHTNNLPGHLCPMELRPPRAKKSHTQSSSAWNAVQNRKMFQLIQVRLHHRTAWNSAFTTWKKAAQNLHFFPDRHVQWNAGYKAPCAKDPSITPAVAPAGAAPSSSSSTSSSTKHQTSSSTKHSDVQVPSKTVLGTRPERGSERGANEVRTRSEGDPQSFTSSHITSDKNRTWMYHCKCFTKMLPADPSANTFNIIIST